MKNFEKTLVKNYIYKRINTVFLIHRTLMVSFKRREAFACESEGKAAMTFIALVNDECSHLSCSRWCGAGGIARVGLCCARNRCGSQGRGKKAISNIRSSSSRSSSLLEGCGDDIHLICQHLWGYCLKEPHKIKALNREQVYHKLQIYQEGERHKAGACSSFLSSPPQNHKPLLLLLLLLLFSSSAGLWQVA